MTTEETRAAKETIRLQRRAVVAHSVLCGAAILAVAAGAALIYAPAGLVAGGLLLYIDVQRG